MRAYRREQIVYGSPSSSENRTYLGLLNFQVRIKFFPNDEFSNGYSYFVLKEHIKDNECM